MQFSFEVNPDLDVAIGMEADYAEVYEESYVAESFEPSGVDPLAPTGAKPGSEDKVQMLSARYAAGVPLWHDSDCYDHGPAALNGADFGATEEDDENF